MLLFKTLYATLACLFLAFCAPSLAAGKDTMSIATSSAPYKTDISVVSSAKAREIFEAYANNRELPLIYLPDGVYATAHREGHILENANIIAGKFWVEGNLSPNHPQWKSISWGYRVAIVLFVQSETGPRLMVFDPALAAEPVSPEQWKASLLNAPSNKIASEYYTPRFHYDPSNRNDRLDKYDPDDMLDAIETATKYRTLLKRCRPVNGIYPNDCDQP